MAKARNCITSVELPKALFEKASAILLARGTTLDDFVRLQLLRLTKNEKFYGVGDQICFGKYRDETVATIIRGDPEYMVWCLQNVAGFGLTPEALDLLQSTGVDFP